MKLEQHDLNSKVNLLWLFGNWTELAEIAIPQDNPELCCYKAAALFQLSRADDARLFLADCVYDKQLLLNLLVSGVYNNLARAHAVLNSVNPSDQYFIKSLSMVNPIVYDESMTRARKAEQLSQLKMYHRWLPLGEHESINRKNKLFIDCGGHDGCSVIQFLLENPDYDVISFEANPELWVYYDNLPTTLIKKAVYDYDGEVEFLLDPIDADGSSLIKDKKIDFTDKVSNEDCPRIIVPCVDLSGFIARESKKYDKVVLKLDVEGAEYAILTKMLKDDTMKLVSHLFAEFHWNKIGLSEEEHNAIVESVGKFVSISYWDANCFSVHKKKQRFLDGREILKGVLV